MEAATDIDLATNDLGPLAWVLDELRKSLESASSALRRFVRDTGLARGEDMASVDTGQLRIARQHMHQAVGALEMVGLGAPAHVLRAMEAAVQKFVERPELCVEAASQKVERAGFALTEYLEAVLHGKKVSPISLFPQYKDVQELAGADRVHPADLWLIDWRWNEPAPPHGPESLSYDAAVRSRMDQAVLKIVKSADPDAARELAAVSLALGQAQPSGQPKAFWKICAGYFEAVSLGLLPADIYVKRAASRVLMQYASLAKGELAVSDRLAQDLVFFCSQAIPPAGAGAESLAAVRQAYGLDRYPVVDWATSPFGRFDPVLLSQARKRIAAAKETWSALSGGEAGKLKSVADQFNLVTDSIGKLHPQGARLAQALTATIDSVVRAGRPPFAELAMEVATAVLYLEAAFQDLDPDESQLAMRTSRLAERLDTVRGGGQPEPLEAWMEELYRRVSDRQTMGSVVGELRGTLAELEKLLDQFFRNTSDKTPLRDAPAHLGQMRGVLSVLGMDQASNAVQRMRETVEAIILASGEDAAASQAALFDKLGNNLGALGFLIDMLNYQPTLAKKLFVYDDARGELRPLMGRTGEADAHAQPAAQVAAAPAVQVAAPVAVQPAVAPAAAADFDLPGFGTPQPVAQPQAAMAAAPVAAPAPVLQPAAPGVAQAPVAADADEGADDELLDIFLEEAREVVTNGLAAIEALVSSPADVSEMTTLRRAFHTLKGSSRMVGLNEFGEAGWAMEQVMNAWLGDQKPASDDLLALCADALRGLGRWVEDIAAKTDPGWKASMFRGPADAMRSDQRLVTLQLPSAAAPVAAAALQEPVAEEAPVTGPAQAAPADPALVEAMAFLPEEPQAAAQPEPEPEPAPAPAQPVVADVAALADFDLDLPPAGEQPAEPAVAAELADFDLDVAPGLPEAGEAAPEPVAEIEGIDFGSLSALTAAAPEDEPAAAQPEPEPVRMAQPEPEVEPEAAVDGRDEQIKVIGPLRIAIPLYNVYLNEADEWSRRLVTEVGEWALELNQPIPESTIGWAHSLAGSSATVGFQALSEIARALESALEHAQTLAHGTPQHAVAFTAAAEEIRRLLHQFAAGFLKQPDPQVVHALQDLQDIEVPLRGDGPAEADAAAASEEDAPLAHAAPLAPLAQPATFLAPVAGEATVRDASLSTDDDLDVTDVIDPDLFPIFEEEGAELMPQLGGALRQWAARPENRSARDECLRALHTLKGSARLAGALRLGEMAHRLESQIEYLGSDNVAPEDIDELLQRFDAMQARFDAMRNASANAADVAAAQEPGMAPEAPDAGQGQAHALSAQPQPQQAEARTALALPAGMVVAPMRQAANQAVRVRAHLLDRLVNQAGEVMITRSRLEEELRQLRVSLADLTGNLDRLRAQLREIEVQAESQMQSRLAQAKDTAQNFDPLEFDRFTRVQELTRFMAESVNDVATVQRNIQRVVEATEDDLIAQARQTRELQRDLLRTRMVEFEGISDRLYRVVRLAAKESGKQVKLDIVGGSIEMDRGVLDRMTPAFEHLLRNCVAHGVEAPELRAARGKDAAGSIVVSLAQEGNDVSVEFRDDGAGLDLARIRAKAQQQGLVAPGQQLTDAEAANLIFLPGFSTASTVTELAGRGIGMDVVRSEVNALGGRIETSTREGGGTTFKLVLPLTTAVTQVVMIRCGSLSVGVPANMVEMVRRATAKEVEQAYNSGTYEFAGEQLPFFWSGALLQSSARSREPQGRTLPVLIFRSAAQRVAVHVDEVLGNQEVVVKNLGPQLSRLPGMAGMTVLASGAVVLIYNPVALAQVYGDQARRLSADRAQPEMLERANTPAVPEMPAAPAIPLVLVVDDSITVRRVTQRLLQREGYRVSLAADGLQALERLAEERPAVVLSDIEMPRMDGFDLARNIRADKALAQLPVIMITSRIAEKHREHARELGVNHYLGKPYAEEELLSLVKHYATAAATAA